MKTDRIISQVITPRATGYCTAIGVGVSILSGNTNNKILRKVHKPSAFITAGLALLHIGLIEYNNYKFKKIQSGK